MPELPSLLPNFTYVVEHLAQWALLFVGLFLALAFLLVREKVGAMLLGFFRTIGSVFTSPFVYLKKICLQLAAFGTSGDQSFRSSRLYLVNKLLVAVQAVLIVTVLSGLTVTIMTAWDAFLPPASLRNAVTELELRLPAERREQEAVSSRVHQLETEWETQGKTIVEKHKSDKKQSAVKATAANTTLADSLESDVEMRQPLQALRNYLTQNDGGGSEGVFESTKKNAATFVGRIDLPEAKQGRLLEYISNWHTAKISELQVKAMSEESIRAEVQPDYRQVKQRAGPLVEMVRADEQRLAELRSAATYRPIGLLLRLAEGGVAFLATVWLFGLLIEAVSLAVHVADDVRAVRQFRVVEQVGTVEAGAEGSPPEATAIPV